MAGKTVNPTRMELTRLKGRLKTARRGHKLLKDKRDELMKQFMDVVRRNRALRAKVEQGLKEANAAGKRIDIGISNETLETAAMTGEPWQQVYRQRVREVTQRRKDGLYTLPKGATPEAEPVKPEEE